MKHHLSPELPLAGIDCGVVYCGPLYTLVKLRGLQPVDLDLTRLSFNSLEIIQDTDIRYRSANLRLPGLAVEQGGRYRILDGRHRIKRAQDTGVTHLPFYIVPLPDAMKYYQTS
jgi:hypothetical protein